MSKAQNSKLVAGQLLTLQAKMSVIPGNVDGDPSMKRFSRNAGEVELAEGTPVTFAGYEKLSINGKTKRQPVVTATVQGETVRIFAYRDHLIDNGEGMDQRAFLEARIEKLETDLDAARTELANLPEEEAKIAESASDETETL